MDELNENEEYELDGPGYEINEKLNSLKNFLERGLWQAALIDEKGKIYKNVEKCLFTKAQEGKIAWSFSNKRLKPVLWFGINDRINEDCWTVRAHKYKNENKVTFCDHLAVRLKYGDLNWNILMDGNSVHNDYYYNWIAELGIDDLYVTEKAFEVFEFCPIKVTPFDDFDSIENKLNDYFISNFKLT